MKEQMEELQRLDGVGEVLSRRLIEAGYDTIGKVAGARGLERIAGMNAEKARTIVAQARKITGEAAKSRPAWKR